MRFRDRLLILALLLATLPLATASQTIEGQTARPVRVAVIGLFQPPTTSAVAAAGSPTIALAEALAKDARVSIVDRAQFQPAISGIGYDGSLNLTTLEARHIGAAIGCDFFIIGKAEVIERSERENQSHQEAIIAVLIVDGRTGALSHFDFIVEKAPAPQEALVAASHSLVSRAKSYAERMIEFREAGRAAQSRSLGDTRKAASHEASLARVEQIPEEGSPRAVGFKAPEFLNRIKPEYTIEADRADISATVEAVAVFRSDGQVGAVEITRWAGFGLDESAERAIRQLKFKPATRDGQPISVRATVRYNFRRLDASQAAQPPTAAEPAPKAAAPARDLRELFKPRYRRP